MDKEENNNILDFGDIGGFDIGFDDFNSDDFNLMGIDEDAEENRYTKPKIYKVSPHFVSYDNAEKLAKDLRLNFNERSDVIVSGNFIFGDFIEAYITTHNATCKKMTISTLSLSQENADSLRTLLEFGFVEELNLVVSAYFYAHERRTLIPYIYKELDYKNKFQLAIAGIHTKTCQFETLGGRKIIIYGSANLRSSGNIEQFTIEENAELYNFYDELFSRIIQKYNTIRKPLRSKNFMEWYREYQ